MPLGEEAFVNDAPTLYDQRRGRAGLAVLALMAALAAGLSPGAARTVSAQEPRYEHRVVVATTSRDRELDVEESLARNVNQFAALGFEVGAIVGGDGRLVDQLLERKPYAAGIVDHGGHVLVIMSRPVGRPPLAREYRFLHARTALGVEKIVAEYGQDGFRLTVTATEGGYFHAVFERGESARRTRVSCLQDVGGARDGTPGSWRIPMPAPAPRA